MGILIYGSGGGIRGGTDYSTDTATPLSVRAGETFHGAAGGQEEGMIRDWTGTLVDGASPADEPMVITPLTGTKHIEAGVYLDRDVELQAMSKGNIEYTTKTDAATGEMYLEAAQTGGYIDNGTEKIKLDNYLGRTDIMPGTDDIVLATKGMIMPKDIIVRGDPDLVEENIAAGETIFGKTGTFANTGVILSGTKTVTTNNTTVSTKISDSSGYEFISIQVPTYSPPTGVSPNVITSNGDRQPTGGYPYVNVQVPTTAIQFGYISSASDLISFNGGDGCNTMSITAPSGSAIKVFYVAFDTTDEGRVNMIAGCLNQSTYYSTGRQGISTQTASATWSGSTVTVTLTGAYFFKPSKLKGGFFGYA